MIAPLRVGPVLLVLGFLSLSGCSRSKPPPAPPAPPPPFTLQLERAPVGLEQGGKGSIRVIAARNDYQGRIGVELRDLPPGVKADEAVIREGDRAADIQLTAADDAATGNWDSVRAVGTALDGADRHVADARFRVSVAEPRLFDLQVEPATLGLGPGGRASIKVIANRKRYDGPITVELHNLPGRVSAGKALIREGENEVIIDVEAGRDAPLGSRSTVRAVATATAARNRQTAAPFTVHLRPPFELRVVPAEIKLEQGDRAKLKVTTLRHDYRGPIRIEVPEAPPRLRVIGPTLSAGQTEGVIELEAADDAPVRSGIKLMVRGMPADPDIPPAGFAVNLAVTPPLLFDLSVEPRTLTLVQGGSARLRVTAIRKKYDGPITIELLNLPAGVSAAKAVIPHGQSAADIEVTAEAGATAGDRSNLAVLATAIAAGNTQMTSPSFTLRLQRQAPSFDLRVEPAIVRLTQGGTGRVKVTATRHTYQGAIDIRLRNLPARVNAAPAVIPPGRSTVEIDLNAGAEAPPGDKKDVVAIGSAAGGPEIVSPTFTLRVAPAAGTVPRFELKVDPAIVRLKPGAKGTVRVTAIRHGYDGPIHVELINLPRQVRAAREVIDRRKDSVEIDLLADARADTVEQRNVQAVGTTTVGPNLRVVSADFTVTVQANATGKQAIAVRVEPREVRLTPGGKAKVKVSVTRRNYEGPVAVELRDLPNQVTAPRMIIPANQNIMDIELLAGVRAVPGRKDVQVAASAVVGAGVEDTATLTVTVQKK